MVTPNYLTVKYFDIYSLNYSHIEELKKEISSYPAPLQPKFQNAFNAESMKEKIENGKQVYQSMSPMILQQSDEQKLTEASRVMANFVKNAKEASENAQALLNRCGNVDHYQLQLLVNYVLGIEDLEGISCTDLVKERYFSAMKKSGFLDTPYSSLQQKPVYQPGLLASEFLSQHPEIKTMTLACGEAGSAYPGSCYSRRPEDHAQESFTIDSTGGMGPRLVDNMHDPDLWKCISNGRFERVFDHSMGYFLFNDPQSQNTIENIYRVLQQGGCLKMDHSFEPKHVEMLKTAGFFIENENGKIAKKL